MTNVEQGREHPIIDRIKGLYGQVGATVEEVRLRIAPPESPRLRIQSSQSSSGNPHIDSQRGKAAEHPSDDEIVIISELQRSNFDCGQTVLDMLGYKGHEMFPDKEISSGDLRGIPGAKEVTLPVGQEEQLDYRYPKVWIFVGKGKVAGSNHWVIRHDNRIYCPTIGEMNAVEYKGKYVGFVLQEFQIPVKGQAIPEQYYQRHGSASP